MVGHLFQLPTAETPEEKKGHYFSTLKRSQLYKTSHNLDILPVAEEPAMTGMTSIQLIQFSQNYKTHLKYFENILPAL
jgi:hypothetical protein